MNLDPLLLTQLLILGCATGFLAGLLGIGGGMVLVPILTLLLTIQGFPSASIIKIAVASSLATICFTSLSSLRAHHRRRPQALVRRWPPRQRRWLRPCRAAG